jgi:hypothetical protein
MANVLLTINMITREAVRLWKNTNAFMQNIDTQYDDAYAKTGAKIGTSLRIRLPNDFTVRTGPAASVQDTSEQSTTLVLATQKGVDVSFNSVDRTMSLDDFSIRILAPMVNKLAGAVAQDIMNQSEGGVSNAVANFDGSNNVLTPTSAQFLDGGATLDIRSAPVANRKVCNSPRTEARMVDSLKGLLNPTPEIDRQYYTGRMYDALGFVWMKDQTVIQHTTGTMVTATVNGAGQTGLSILVNAITGTLVAGDIIQFAGVDAVNRITDLDTGELAQFVVTANVPNGGTTIPIYPAMIPPVGGQPVQYQTVTASPANAAVVTPFFNPASTFRKNIEFVPEAITFATADLVIMDRGVVEAAREEFDGVSMRMLTAYDVMTDQLITRLDVLYGVLYIRPEWCVIVADRI